MGRTGERATEPGCSCVPATWLLGSVPAPARDIDTCRNSYWYDPMRCREVQIRVHLRARGPSAKRPGHHTRRRSVSSRIYQTQTYSCINSTAGPARCRATPSCNRTACTECTGYGRRDLAARFCPRSTSRITIYITVDIVERKYKQVARYSRASRARWFEVRALIGPLY